jgi:hypothetical protein
MPETATVEKFAVNIKVNGKPYPRQIEPRMLLVEFLRETCDLTGTHVGCDTTYCGACTVLMNGLAIKSCTVFAVQADGSEITTVEGLEKDGKLRSDSKSFRRFVRPAVWLLHARSVAVHPSVARPESRAKRKGNSQSDRRQHLPLHRVHERFQGHRQAGRNMKGV